MIKRMKYVRTATIASVAIVLTLMVCGCRKDSKSAYRDDFAVEEAAYAYSADMEMPMPAPTAVNTTMRVAQKSSGTSVQAQAAGMNGMETGAGAEETERKLVKTGSISFEVENRTALEKVTLPEGLTKLSYRLFKGCTDLKEIYIPASVTEFATEIFSECKNLTAIKVDRYTEAHAFFSADERIVLTNSRAKQTKEQWIATAKNSILDDGILYVGHGVTKINDGQYKNKDIKEIVFSDTVERIGNGAFQGNKELKKVVIPGNVKTIADGAFAGLNLEEVVCEEGVEKIQVYAFYGCSKLNSVTLPKSATTIVPDGLYWENKDSRVFHCYAGSLAYNLAVKNGYKKIDIIGVDEQNAASIDLTYLCLSGNKTVKAGLFRDVPIEKIDLGNDITEIGKSAFNDTLRIQWAFLSARF